MSSERFDLAVAEVDAANLEDPREETWEGRTYPKELIYGRRMSTWLEKLVPQASEALRLAVRAQHIRRWMKPRDQYPMDRKGYHLWRTELYGFHAQEMAGILQSAGYDAAMIERVGDLIQKKRLKSDEEAQALEDVACLVFLEFYFADFASHYDDEKVIAILQRTWKKMSDRGHAAALSLELSEVASRLVKKALSAI